MKTTLFCLLLLIALYSCSISKVSQPRYVAIAKIKAQYSLTNKQCDQLSRDAMSGKVPSYYNPVTDCRLFDPEFDYSNYSQK